MKSIKMRGVVAAVTGALLFGFGANAMADSTTDIVNTLIAKGVLTEEEGALINKGREAEVKKTDSAIKKAGKLSVSDAINKAEVYGDIRARYERRDGVAGEDNKDYETNRPRYKMTLGVKTEAGDWYGDLAFAASAKGTSDNITLGSTNPGAGSGMSPKNDQVLYIKRAMLGWKATDWLSIEAGRMANPLYKVNAMVWDGDIVVEGLNQKIKYKMGDTELFANLGQWVYGNNYTATDGTATKQPSMLFAFQGGLKQPLIDKKASFKGAVSYYQYSGNSTGTAGAFSPWLGTSGRGAAASSAITGTNTTTYTAAVKGTTTTGASVNDLSILDIPVEFNYMVQENIGAKLYGEYANNLSGSDRAAAACALGANGGNVCGLGDDHDAWLVGLTVGSAKDLKSFEGNKLAKGDWSANLWYQSVGAYALDPNSVDSDIFDSRTNMEGTALKVQYNVEDNVALNFTGAWGSRKNDALGAAGTGGDISKNIKDLDLYQFDVTYKF